MEQATKDLLRFLNQNPVIRECIAAPEHCTILWAGRFFGSVRDELKRAKQTSPELVGKRFLDEVLEKIETPGRPQQNLLEWAEVFSAPEWRDKWSANGFIVWRALSGIYACNARGRVSFYIGSGVTKFGSVFSATEIPVLKRNPHLDVAAQDMLEYYERCIQKGPTAVNLGYITR